MPPLPNIPYCCLPQESGPCLSTSVGDRPLRSPSHRGLGGPSPRRPSNGTHARPPPPVGFARPGMPPLGRMAHYPAFPPAVRRTGAGCIRVTHPCATLATPKGRLPFDLHVLGLPLAFILSQDQTLRCNIVLLFVVFSVSRVPPPQGPRPRIAARTAPRLDCSLSGIPKALRPRDACAGLRISKNSRPRIPDFPALRPSRKRVQKYNLFPSPQ